MYTYSKYAFQFQKLNNSNPAASEINTVPSKFVFLKGMGGFIAVTFVNPLHKSKMSDNISTVIFSHFMRECHTGDTRFLCDGIVKCLGWKDDSVHAAQKW